mmetsp:Transcript_13762/g.27844  ORF Transcript_13762/g.27844 Transcript_13762/m.27844 type:complete len:83 (-) Transcript_13762:193-441(-)
MGSMPQNRMYFFSGGSFRIRCRDRPKVMSLHLPLLRSPVQMLSRIISRLSCENPPSCSHGFFNWIESSIDEKDSLGKAAANA